ncbi:hypothetical protein DFH09DRAFT_1071020 [Mycena vulgaris]|nr:hypothetical protein DFH09DRAFT_1071020 [Mycena vulgaris]
MDDDLLKPTVAPRPQEDDGNESDGEEDVPGQALETLPRHSQTRPTSSSARDAMFDTLCASRTILSKAKNWLLPEEALYLVERGSMVCTKHGGPISVQQAYADMLGHDIPFEAYQVYAYLKRLGYNVTRYRSPFPDYPSPGPRPALAPLLGDPSSIA